MKAHNILELYLMCLCLIFLGDNIDYYIHWKGEDELPFTEGAYKEITSDKYSEFRIYALGRE